MRKLITAGATLALLPAAVLAANVVLYGKVNTALYFEDYRGASPTVSIANEGSRFGLLITEDLSDGWGVKGYLENGFNSDDGAFTNTSGGNSGTTLFDRRAILAVQNDRFGEIGFGRMGTVRSTMAPYAMTLAWLDPFETNYGDAGMSYMFGNDPRSNNAITYVSPKWGSFSFGTTYSFSFTDQEEEHASANNRLWALALTYAAGPVSIHAGATQLWYAYDEGATGVYDTARSTIDREDARAYSLGFSWTATDALKLFAAAQYQDDWRSVAGWNADSASTHRTSYGDKDREHGIDGWTGMIGLQYKFTNALRFLGKYVYFDGEHDMGDGSTVDGTRHAVNTGLEYKLSKRTKAYVVASYFKGKDELDVDKLNGVTGHIGLEHNF